MRAMQLDGDIPAPAPAPAQDWPRTRENVRKGWEAVDAARRGPTEDDFNYFTSRGRPLGQDTAPAMLQPGERVLTVSQGAMPQPRVTGTTHVSTGGRPDVVLIDRMVDDPLPGESFADYMSRLYARRRR